LADDIMTALDAAQAAEAVDAELSARVKRRVLRRIAADATPQHTTVPAEAPSWRPFGRGVQIKVLHEAGGVMSYLLKLQAGAKLAPHRHPIDEECVVLEGTLRVGDELELTAGSFHLGRRDVLHASIVAVSDATIFLRGAAPEPAHIL
jgi:anti-sigma factor ChrR (cupin superfamily)